MSNDKIIDELLKAGLVATCPRCFTSCELNQFTLFDGLGSFPALAVETKEKLAAELDSRLDELKKKKTSVADAEERAIRVGVGKTLEKIIPYIRTLAYHYLTAGHSLNPLI